MPNATLPVRGLGSVGIIADINPYDLPPAALSAGVNVRFENGKITRGPVIRRVYEYETGFSPAFMFSLPPVSSSYEGIVAVSKDMATIKQVIGNTESDLSPTGFTGADLEMPFTHTFLGGVSYLNRKSHAPLHKLPGDAIYSTLPNWDAGWRCASLRTYKDFLVALNVTKGAVNYPTMVKWSDLTGYGSAPGSWDHESTTNSAGESVINEMKVEIIDGLGLRDSFILYGRGEVWTMDYIGGNYLFRWRKLFDKVGILNQNCVVQIDGLHYVFDKDDIYLHDGSTKKSIIHGKDKDFVFQSLNYGKSWLAFVNHDPRLNEIHFCYHSGDRFARFQGGLGCNRAAVYNYRLDNWTFYDLPNVTSGCLSTVSSALSYNDVMDSSYQEMGGSYVSNEDDKDLHAIFVAPADSSIGLTESRIYGLDLFTGGRLVKPLEPEVPMPSFVERVGIDLDEIGADLTLYKVLQAIYPQLGVRGEVSNVSFQFGASDIVGHEPLWSDTTTYDPRTDNKVDIREAGRYLAYRLYHDGPTDFTFSGFDLKVSLRGRR